MKKIIIIFIVLASLYFINFNNDKSPVIVDDTEEIIKEREKYEFIRLRDVKSNTIPLDINHQIESLLKKNFYHNTKNKSAYQSSYNWTRRGPYQIGGRTRAFAIDIKNKNRILAGATSGGLWLSEDGGSTWNKISDPLHNHSISAIVQDTRPGKENIWYYGTGERIASKLRFGNGIYKSVDNGMTWVKLVAADVKNEFSWDSSYDYIYRLIINPAAPDSLDELYVAGSLSGIYKSSDGGESFQQVLGSNISNNNSYVSDIAVSETGVFYATMSGFRTTNSAIDSINYQAIYKGLYRSIDGDNWVDITPDDYSKYYSRVVLDINPSNENEVYFFAQTYKSGIITTNSRGDSLYHSLFRYNYIDGDGAGAGGKWENLSDNLPKTGIVRHQLNSQRSYNMVIRVHPQNPDIVYLGAVNLYRYTNAINAEEWEIVGGTCIDNTCDYFYRYPNHHSDVHELIFDRDNPNILYTGTDGGLHKTIDNQASILEWQSLNNGYVVTQFYDIGIDHADNGNTNLIGGMQDNGTAFTNNEDTEHHWTEVLRADGFNCELANNNEFIITSQNYSIQPKIRIWKSELDDDGNVTKTRRIDPMGGEDFQWNTPLALDPKDNNILYIAGGRYIWKQKDLSAIELDGSKDSLSQGWVRFDSTLVEHYDDNENILRETISAIEPTKDATNRFYYGTSLGYVYRIDNASEDNPEVLNINNNMVIGNNISCIATDPYDSDKVFVVFSNYNAPSIFYSENAGESWTNVGGSLEYDGISGGPAVLWLEILPIGEERLYLAGTSNGLFITSIIDGNSTPWEMESQNLIGNTYIANIDSRESDGFVAIGSYANGIYSGFINELPAKPKSPSPQFPPDGYNSTLDTLTFKWESGNSGYDYLEISKSEEFTEIILKENLVDTEIKIFDLELGEQKYFWRLRKKGAGGFSDYSEIFSFTTIPNSPMLIYPENKSKEIPYTKILFQWENESEFDNFQIQIDDLRNFATPIVDELLDTKLYGKSLEKNERYYWRVKGIKNGVSSYYSKEYSFVTNDIKSVYLNENELKLKRVKSSNSFYLEYDKTKIHVRKLILINLQGKKFDLGNTTLINLENYIRGAYTLHIITDEGIIQKKIIL